MKALILNSGMGTRMGDLTKDKPKCLTNISNEDTILSLQLKNLLKNNINDVVITTGYFDKLLIDYVKTLKLNQKYTYVKNPLFETTNYIYSIYLAKEFLNDDIILMHGDLVFENNILDNLITGKSSKATISSTALLPQKDFKAVIINKKIEKIGINYFDNAYAMQPLYYLNKREWKIWLNEIIKFCENNNTKVYAEEAFNNVSVQMQLLPLDVKDKLCNEIDNLDDLEKIRKIIKEYQDE